MNTDNYIEYLKLYYSKHKTINDINRSEIVEFNGQTLKIGEFLASIRKQHKLFVVGDSSRSSMSKTSMNRYKELEKLEIDWTPQETKTKQLEENDVCLLFVQRYYKQHKTLENIPDTFKIDDKEYSIKNFFAHIRTNHKNYISNQNSKGSNSKTALRRYKILDEMGFDWEPLKTQAEEDLYMEYIKTHYNQYKTLKNLPSKIIYKETELNLETFLSDRRKKYKKSLTDTTYTLSELEQARIAYLQTTDFDWTPQQTKHAEMMENDICMRYLQKRFKETGTINDITAKEEVTFEGKVLKIGIYINELRKKHNAVMKNNESVTGKDTELMNKRYSELEKMNFNWRPSETNVTLAKIARQNGFKTRHLKKYLAKFDGDIDKAIKILKARETYKRTQRKTNKNSGPSLATIAKEFEINIPALTTLLNRPALQTSAKSPTLMYDENTNLRQYCINNGLNYTVIQKAIKLRMSGLSNHDLQELINICICEYKTKGQNQPSTWIYTKYGNEILVSHLLTYLNLDSEAIFNDMSRNCISLEQAMENNSFKRTSKQEYDYLEFIYRGIVTTYNKGTNNNYPKDLLREQIEDEILRYKNEYNLNSSEVNIIKDSFRKYAHAIEQYRLFDVGFEKDEKEKIQKIIKYNLDEDEVEEAFFMPLKFDQKALIGRDSEIYKRRVLLKNLTVCWGYITPEERQNKVAQHKISNEELKYITTTRNEIDTIKEKVYTKK